MKQNAFNAGNWKISKLTNSLYQKAAGGRPIYIYISFQNIKFKGFYSYYCIER